MTSPERRYSMEHSLRSELLQFDTGKVKQQRKESSNDTSDSKTKDTSVNNYISYNSSASPPTASPTPLAMLTNERSNRERDEEERYWEIQEAKRKWAARIQREGHIGNNGLLDLFTPEQLVATSNDGKFNKCIFKIWENLFFITVDFFFSFPISPCFAP